eukprot:9303333-Alexandrium_andersonii.AAC.1
MPPPLAMLIRKAIELPAVESRLHVDTCPATLDDLDHPWAFAHMGTGHRSTRARARASNTCGAW